MDLQAQILALLHGELKEGDELASLLNEIAHSPDGQAELLDQMKMSRHFAKLGDVTSPSAHADQSLLQKISARTPAANVATVPSGNAATRFLPLKQAVWIALFSLAAFLLGLGLAGVWDTNAEPVIAPATVPSPETLLSETVPEQEHPEPVRDTVVVSTHSSLSNSNVVAESIVAKGLISRLYLDGVDDVVMVPGVPMSLDSSFTIAVDVMPEKAGQNGVILAFVTPDETGDFLMELKEGKLRVLTYSLYGEANEVLSEVKVQPNTVSQIVCVQDFAVGTLQLFLDNELVGSVKTKSLGAETKTGTLLAGARRWYNTAQLDGYFRGSLGHIRIWDDPLNPDKLGQGGSRMNSLIGFWSLTDLDVENSSVPDKSGNGYMGIARGHIIPPQADVSLLN